MGVELLGSKMEEINGVMSGNLGSLNCYGEEKVRRIKEAYDLNEFSEIYVYGDSRGDREMIGLAREDKAFFRLFK